MTNKKQLYASVYVGWMMTIVPHKLEALYDSGVLENRVKKIVEETINEEQYLIQEYSLKPDEARLRAFQKYVMPSINHKSYEDQKKYPKLNPEELVDYSRKESIRYITKTYKPILGGSSLSRGILSNNTEQVIARSRKLKFWQNKRGDSPLVLQIELGDFLCEDEFLKANVLYVQAAREMQVLPKLFELKDLTLKVSSVKVNEVYFSYQKSLQALLYDTKFIFLKKYPFKLYPSQIIFKPLPK